MKNFFEFFITHNLAIDSVVFGTLGVIIELVFVFTVRKNLKVWFLNLLSLVKMEVITSIKAYKKAKKVYNKTKKALKNNYEPLNYKGLVDVILTDDLGVVSSTRL